MAEALGRFGLTAVSARKLDARYRSGPAGEAWLRLPLEPPAITERPRLALIQRLPLSAPELGDHFAQDPWVQREHPQTRLGTKPSRGTLRNDPMSKTRPGTSIG